MSPRYRDLTAAVQGGIKVVTEAGWFAARPSAPRTSTSCPEPFRPPGHLARIQVEAQELHLNPARPGLDVRAAAARRAVKTV